MPQTPNHNYNVPTEGKTDWHQPLNENFEAYDTDIEIRDDAANRSNYTPKVGAKFLATDTGRVYLGDGSRWQSLRSTGTNPEFDRMVASQVVVDSVLSSYGPIHIIEPEDSENEFRFLSEVDGTPTTRVVHRYQDLLDNYEIELLEETGDDGVVGYTAFSAARDGSRRVTLGESETLAIEDGTVTMDADLDLNGRVQNVLTSAGPMHIVEPEDSENEFRMLSEVNGTPTTRVVHRYQDLLDSYEIELLEETGDEVVSYTAFNAKRDGSRRVTVGANEAVAIENGTVTVDGDFDVTGNKNFAQTVDTDDGEREVVYTATEAPTPRTEASGVAELEDGRAEIELPDHFAWVTSDDDPLVVQTTPYGHGDGLVVVERSPDRLVVEDRSGGGDYEFAYTVKGTRDGHGDKRVVREPSASNSIDDADSFAPADD